ncbi:MAG: hypothetical protein AAFR47_17860 [Pseudomonadota bacterium]
MFDGDYLYVAIADWPVVQERNNAVIPINLMRLNLSRGDAAEETINRRILVCRVHLEWVADLRRTGIIEQGGPDAGMQVRSLDAEAGG